MWSLPLNAILTLREEERSIIWRKLWIYKQFSALKTRRLDLIKPLTIQTSINDHWI